MTAKAAPHSGLHGFSDSVSAFLDAVYLAIAGALGGLAIANTIWMLVGADPTDKASNLAMFLGAISFFFVGFLVPRLLKHRH